MKIAIELVDDITGKRAVAHLSMHNAQKLYGALREIIGDAQYQSQPGQLITVPDAKIKV